MDRDDQDYQEEQEDNGSNRAQDLRDNIDNARNLNQRAQQARGIAGKMRGGGKAALRGGKAALRLFKFVRFIPPQILIPALAIIVLFIIIFLMVYVIFFTGGNKKYFTEHIPIEGRAPEGNTGDIIPPWVISLTVTSGGTDLVMDDEVVNGSDIIYLITLTYDPVLLGYPAVLPSSRAVFDIIPPGTTFYSASGCTPSAGPPPYVQCPLINPPPAGPVTTMTMSWQVRVTPSVTDTYVYNTVVIGMTGGAPPAVSGVSTSSLISPAGQGEIAEKNTIQEFTKDNLYNLLLSLDPTNADLWFYKIIPCESGFDPESRNQSLSGASAIGLFQFLDQSGDPNATIPWQDQVGAAIEYNRSTLGGTFSYWKCAK